MKNSKIITLIISSVFIFYNLLSCNSDVKIGIPKSTDNIKESNSKGFFISKYIPSKSIFNLNDTIYKINETWTEKEWIIKNDDLDLEKTGKTNFIIHFENDWVDRIVYKRNDFTFNGMGYTRNKMIFNLTENEIKKDTMTLYFLIKKDTIPIIFIKKK
jgi:hypothetical protein